MAYVNTDLQSLPGQTTDLRVGTDKNERTLQLAFWQLQAAQAALREMDVANAYPQAVIDADGETAFDTAIGNIVTALTTATTNFDTIFALV